MFRVKGSEIDPSISWVLLALLLLILIAALVTSWLTWTLSVERSPTSDLNYGNGEIISERPRVLPRENRWHVGLAIVVLMILVVAAGLVLVVHRAYLTSRRSLREVKVLAGDIFASMIQGVVSTNCHGIITSINSTGSELLCVGSECVGHPIAVVSSPEIPLDQLSREVLLSGVPAGDRAFTVLRNGHTKRLQADCHLLHDTNGAVLGSVLHVRDVTEHMLVEERMRRMERYLGLGSLAVGLHHEIKNPLTALSLHVQLLDELLTRKRVAGVNEMLGVLKTEVTRLNGVLETFRDFAAFRTLSVHPTDIAELVDKAVRLVRPQAEKQHVRIVVTRPELPLQPVLMDSVKFEQVVLNLIINALEAMPNGGEMTIRFSVSNGQFHFEVADTGCGIPPEARARIFDPYFTTKRDGVGLGLAWSEKIVQQHQGRIEFETGLTGSLFKVIIPMSMSQQPALIL